MTFKPISAHQLDQQQSAPAPVAQPEPTLSQSVLPVAAAPIMPPPLPMAQPATAAGLASATLAQGDPIAAAIAARRDELVQAGSDPAEVERNVRQILSGFDPRQPQAVVGFGKAAGEKVAQYSDDMLAQVRSGNMEGVGDKLTEIVVLAKGVNLSDLRESGSKIPLIGGLIDNFKLKKEKLLGRFETLAKQIDKIVVEIDGQQQKLVRRTQDLEKVYALNVQEYYGLSNHVIAGEVKLEEMRAELDAMRARPDAADPMQAQAIADFADLIQRFDKRVHDLRVMQTVAVQTAPMIRLVQSNNQMLVEKFHNIKALTIPAWKKQFTLAIALIEQKKSVELATKIDDTTNEFLRNNAEMLRQNSLSTARANQRAIVDIETLESVQSTLISTFEEVARIQADGEQKRADAAVRLGQMKQELTTRLAGKM
ncbi:toxic anion resistance protein [Chitinimonas koreensis]|uniref:toxic anion resistance protein n=1 Tax=Chitinimonas koreensis TaxID=356302 RepID=UPI0003FF9C59|nr:toxic anion resistance protein [Chitinimonas koreensis]QNM98175.1 toxic anion resistance protein [Chitinimonas koreensis]